MGRTYIQFEVPENENLSSSDGLLKRSLKKAIIGILTTAIPKANPDYENEIDKVKSWLIELETETGIPQREIGLNNSGKPILKMPHKDNYGYWTDNNLLLDDFKKHFQATEIDQTTFETKWNYSFEMKHDFGFFKTVMPASRKADFYLGCLDSSVFIDFNKTSDGKISLCRISFDGYGCCEITDTANSLNFEMSKEFIEEITKERLDQEKLTLLVKESIKINQEYIWIDALKEYNLIDK